MRKYTLSVFVNDHPGVMQRICGLFSRRGYNLESITVGASEEAGKSRMTIVVKGHCAELEQMMKQLTKLIDVIHVECLNEKAFLSRELMLVKCAVAPEKRHELMSLVETFRYSIIDIGPHSIMIQVVGEVEKNDAFLRVIHSYNLKEITRTGETAMIRSCLEASV
ncbi:acetolactate synthase small subunit [Paenibacillus turpanensis]|uniref:acetolactate synthase small subunit n=1 Tax=Paenibacillus turpanensis TaxID=2689078 RepID=UPI00140BFA03|nr:acetolactate synthase small subunit [Paenibacillus turpanensis]